MSVLNLTARQINKSVPKKLSLQKLETTREQHGDYYLDGKYQFRVTMPNIHGGSGSVSTGMLKIARESVHLTSREYADLVRCPMTGEQYDEKMRDKLTS